MIKIWRCQNKVCHLISINDPEICPVCAATMVDITNTQVGKIFLEEQIPTKPVNKTYHRQVLSVFPE